MQNQNLTEQQRFSAIMQNEAIQSGLFKLLLFTSSDLYHRHHHDTKPKPVEDFLTPEECDSIYKVYFDATNRLYELREE